MGSTEIFDNGSPEEGCILRCIVGSRSYGTSLPESDFDFKGIYIPPAHNVIGIGRDAKAKRYSKDDQSYPLRDFAYNAAKCVPNVLELLFCEEADVVLIEEEGRRLRENRDLFLSKRCVAPYIGYAEAQLAACAVKPMNRGMGRSELVEKFGYDVKFAMHCIRLLQTAEELLTTGSIHVRRPNAEWLISIRLGEAFKDYQEFHEFASSLIEKLKGLEETAPLRPEPDHAAISRLIVDLHHSYWWRHPEIA